MKRLLEDAQLPTELRADLLRARAAGHDYPASAKLLQLRAAVTKRAPQPLDAVKALPKRALHLGWKLSTLVVLGGGGAFLAQTVMPASQPVDNGQEAMQPTAADAGPIRATAARSVATPGLAGRAVTAGGPSTDCSPLPAAGSPTTAPPAAPVAPAPVAPAFPYAPEHSAALPACVASVLAEPSAPEHSTALPVPATRVAAAEASSSRREIAQLVRIRGLIERDPAAARRLAVRSERAFPQGLLSEERRALAIIALTKMGSKQVAEQEAQRYFARYPHSPMRELIEAALRH